MSIAERIDEEKVSNLVQLLKKKQEAAIRKQYPPKEAEKRIAKLYENDKQEEIDEEKVSNLVQLLRKKQEAAIRKQYPPKEAEKRIAKLYENDKPEEIDEEKVSNLVQLLKKKQEAAIRKRYPPKEAEKRIAKLYENDKPAPTNPNPANPNPEPAKPDPPAAKPRADSQESTLSAAKPLGMPSGTPKNETKKETKDVYSWDKISLWLYQNFDITQPDASEKMGSKLKDCVDYMTSKYGKPKQLIIKDWMRVSDIIQNFEESGSNDYDKLLRDLHIGKKNKDLEDWEVLSDDMQDYFTDFFKNHDDSDYNKYKKDLKSTYPGRNPVSETVFSNLYDYYKKNIEIEDDTPKETEKIDISDDDKPSDDSEDEESEPEKPKHKYPLAPLESSKEASKQVSQESSQQASQKSSQQVSNQVSDNEDDPPSKKQNTEEDRVDSDFNFDEWDDMAIADSLLKVNSDQSTEASSDQSANESTNQSRNESDNEEEDVEPDIQNDKDARAYEKWKKLSSTSKKYYKKFFKDHKSSISDYLTARKELQNMGEKKLVDRFDFADLYYYYRRFIKGDLSAKQNDKQDTNQQDDNQDENQNVDPPSDEEEEDTNVVQAFHNPTNNQNTIKSLRNKFKMLADKAKDKQIDAKYKKYNDFLNKNRDTKPNLVLIRYNKDGDRKTMMPPIIESRYIYYKPLEGFDQDVKIVYMPREANDKKQGTYIKNANSSKKARLSEEKRDLILDYEADNDVKISDENQHKAIEAYINQKRKEFYDNYINKDQNEENKIKPTKIELSKEQLKTFIDRRNTIEGQDRDDYKTMNQDTKNNDQRVKNRLSKIRENMKQNKQKSMTINRLPADSINKTRKTIDLLLLEPNVTYTANFYSKDDRFTPRSDKNVAKLIKQRDLPDDYVVPDYND